MTVHSALADEASWPKEVLDRDYNARASVSVALFEAEMKRECALSDAAREAVGGRFDVVYDERSRQAIDLYGLSSEARPVFAYIHGGYWRALTKRGSAFMACGLAAHGVATAVVDYRLAPAVNLTEIVREVRAAIAYLWHSGRQYGIDPERIYIGGSSAGGHLCGALLAAGWHTNLEVPENVVKGGCCSAGFSTSRPSPNALFRNGWRSPRKR
jgi:arylformamidase